MSYRIAQLSIGVSRSLWTCFAVAWAISCCQRTSAADLELRRNPIVRAVERARPSIVNIHGEKTLGAEARTGQAEASRRVNGMGTGVIIDGRGYIITNHHVVEGVKKITVTTLDRDNYVAELISHDLKTDLAIIKITADKELPTIEIGSSEDLMPGETVVAVGNAYGYEHTVTCGIISALHRSVQVSDAQNYEDLIQTDASINPGNSGGPLLNIEGQMIGINVAVRAGAQGIGFAIPTDRAMHTATELLSSRRLANTWHGLVAKAGAASSAVVVDSIDTESPAAISGLKAGDVVKSVGDIRVARPLDIERALLGRHSGDEISFAIERNRQTMKINMVLGIPPRVEKESLDPTWELLGLKLQAIPARQFQQYRTKYRGGLSVTDVRADSPAARQGIRRGDILVGMHVWETVSLDNVDYILGREDFTELDPLKFYLIRRGPAGNETLYGHLTVSHRRAQ